MTAEEVQKTLSFDDRERSNEDLFEIAQTRAFEAKESDEIQVPENPAELSYKQLREILKKSQDLTESIKELDPIFERQSKITAVIDETLKCYREEALEKSKKVVKQTKLEIFFSKVGEEFETSSIEDEDEEDEDEEDEDKEDEELSSDED